MISLALLAAYPIMLIIYSQVYGVSGWSVALFPTLILLGLALSERRLVYILARIYYGWQVIIGILFVLNAKYSHRSDITYYAQKMFETRTAGQQLEFLHRLKNSIPAVFFQDNELTVYGIVILCILYIAMPLICTVVVTSNSGFLALRRAPRGKDLEAGRH